MNIIEFSSVDQEILDELKASSWPAADTEHYGDNQPGFFKKEFVLLAKGDEKATGYISVTCDSGIAKIEELIIRLDLKGNGIGTALLNAAEEKVKILGCHKIWLETGSDWKAKDFYLKQGYNIRTILPNHTGNREFVLMDKII